MSPVSVNYWGEGPTDCAAARRLIKAVGGMPGGDYSGRRRASRGKEYLDANLHRFNKAAEYAPWLVLRDADRECAAELVVRLLNHPAPKMRFRIVVPAIEAWLMADRDAMANFLGVDIRHLPDCPERVRDVKAKLIGIARVSRNRSIKEDMLPVARSGRREGPGYATRMIEFIERFWDPTRAAARAPSLDRAIARLKRVVR